MKAIIIMFVLVTFISCTTDDEVVQMEDKMVNEESLNPESKQEKLKAETDAEAERRKGIIAIGD